MSTHRVLRYRATSHYHSDGHSTSGMYTFTHAQAAEIGAVLEPDGIEINAARRLCEQWTRRGRHDSVSYSYSIPLTETIESTDQPTERKNEMKHDFLSPFRKPNARTLARQELDDAQRQILMYQTQQEYSKRMVEYLSDKINRLSNYLQIER